MRKKKRLSTLYLQNNFVMCLHKKTNINLDINVNKFLFSFFAKRNIVQCYMSLSHFFKKYKIFLSSSFLTLSQVLRDKSLLLNKCRLKIKNFNLYLFVRYFSLKKKSKLTVANNNLCHKFFKNLFFRYNRKFFKKF